MKRDSGFDWRMFLMAIGIAVAVMLLAWAWLYAARGRRPF